MLWNSKRYFTDPTSGRFTNLIRILDDTYRIMETITYEAIEENEKVRETHRREAFEIKSICTMLDTVIVLRTNPNLFFQMELVSRPEVQQLFDLAARPKLYEKVNIIVPTYEKSHTHHKTLTDQQNVI